MKRIFTGWVFRDDFYDRERPFSEVYSDHRYLHMRKVKVTVDDQKKEGRPRKPGPRRKRK